MSSVIAKLKEGVPKTFEVEITETLQMTVEVEAKNAEEAETMVRAAYKDGDYILDADHLMGVEFETTEKKPERARNPKSREPGL